MQFVEVPVGESRDLDVHGSVVTIRRAEESVWYVERGTPDGPRVTAKVVSVESGFEVLPVDVGHYDAETFDWNDDALVFATGLRLL